MFLSSSNLYSILNSLHEWSSSWSSMPFFSTTIQNFRPMSDLLSQVSVFQLNTVYSLNVALCKWQFTCDWGTYFKHWGHTHPLPNICFGDINLPALTLLWFHQTAAVTCRYGQCCVTLRTCKVRLDIKSEACPQKVLWRTSEDETSGTSRSKTQRHIAEDLKPYSA